MKKGCNLVTNSCKLELHGKFCILKMCVLFCVVFSVVLNNSMKLFHKMELLSFYGRVRGGCGHRTSVSFESHYIVDGMEADLIVALRIYAPL